MSALGFTSRFSPMLSNRFLCQTNSLLFSFSSSFSSSLKIPFKALSCSSNSLLHNNGTTSRPLSTSSPLSGLEDELVGYIFGKKKATEMAHLVWRHVLHKGDIAIDATCGNGYDTVAMLKMVADESCRGRVFGMDIQTEALESTSSLLDEIVNQKEKELVKLFPICHSRMDEVLPEKIAVRLVAFNLGYLPGGNKDIITTSKTTMLALESAKKMLMSGGLISLVVYVGHPGGREELETVEGFASGLCVDGWICCKFQMLNRPLAPVLVFIFKR
ncbi:S-adenosyl-L-methionine-dependent methyltransferases superfamily protein isoform 2 [Hibiscus syriacus]|uniref:S-adenosyl-L-methionine-dependent methyltransferases superfamily protein isoform 2 n=1 Tax=Hibiscus syriacus TaxID=106335 RepID=A0A6A2XNR6_HIBSY|nr:putative rRNA methylase YtqB [Hibiscus syriacus]KAE8677238.1 S-adenosyl-L-methionine-dependent methyltransferases superfamily protein isoform 2 [Hibiscus syriacus]